MLCVLLKLEILISNRFFDIVHALTQFFVLHLSDAFTFSKSFPDFFKNWVTLALIKNGVFKLSDTWEGVGG